MHAHQKTKILLVRANDAPEDEPFLKILERLEREAQLTEAEVIRRLGLPRSTYRSWKDGTSEPSKRIYWLKLSQVLGCDLYHPIVGKPDIDSELRSAFISFASYIKNQSTGQPIGSTTCLSTQERRP